MSVLQFQAKLIAAILVTFLLVALEAPAQFCPYGPGKTLAIAFDSRSAGSRKINAGRDGRLDSDKGEVLVGFSFRMVRSLRSKGLPSPPPAPMGNRHTATAKAFAFAPSIHYHHPH